VDRPDVEHDASRARRGAPDGHDRAPLDRAPDRDAKRAVDIRPRVQRRRQGPARILDDRGDPGDRGEERRDGEEPERPHDRLTREAAVRVPAGAGVGAGSDLR
jgi:hypothetical protein